MSHGALRIFQWENDFFLYDPVNNMRATQQRVIPSAIETLEKLGLELPYRVLNEGTLIIKATPRDLPSLRNKIFDDPVFLVELHLSDEEWKNRSEVVRLNSFVKRWWVMPPPRIYDEIVANKELFRPIFFPTNGPFEIGADPTPPRFRE